MTEGHKKFFYISAFSGSQALRERERERERERGECVCVCPRV